MTPEDQNLMTQLESALDQGVRSGRLEPRRLDELRRLALAPGNGRITNEGVSAVRVALKHLTPPAPALPPPPALAHATQEERRTGIIQERTEAPTLSDHRPPKKKSTGGVGTSEFKMVSTALVMAAAAALQQILSDGDPILKAVVLVACILGGAICVAAYAISRGSAKSGD